APLANASVFIHTAAPRDGVGTLCPSCYVDCGKSAKTDAKGRFVIAGLDPGLLFRVLVVAPGFQPEFASHVDPAALPLEISLLPVVEGETPNHRLRGRVMDDNGKPVAGAVARVLSVTRGDSIRFGGYGGTDPLAV